MRSPVPTLRSARRLRRNMSLPEVVLWSRIRAGGLDHRFRRQHPIGPYVLDFYCAPARLCIEIDGAAHLTNEVAGRDGRRDAWLGERGIRVLRFAASDILDDARLEAVLVAIRDAAAPSTAVPAVPLPRFTGEEPD